MALNSAEIEEEVKRLDHESRALRSELLRASWYMRGGLSYTEAHDLTIQEREIINEIVKDNIEVVKKTKLPLL